MKKMKKSADISGKPREKQVSNFIIKICVN